MSCFRGTSIPRCLSRSFAALAAALLLLAAAPDAAVVLLPGGSVVLAAAAEDDAAFLAKAKKLYYYEADKKKRYLKFHKKHPTYKPSTVVWRVNVGLDLGFYVQTTTVDDPDSLTVLVNKNRKLSKSYAPEKLKTISSARLHPDAAKALKKMIAAAKEDGVALYARSKGYRSYTTQKHLNHNTGSRQRSPDYSRARAGHSEHQTGLAVDIKKKSGGYVTSGSKEAKWLTKNAWKYGFIVRYTEDNKNITGYIAEPWHVRYIGVENADLMHAKGYKSYEEFWVKQIAHQPPAKTDTTRNASRE